MNLSIIVPVYNAEKYVEACVRSIANEDFQQENMIQQGIELLLLDDGSSDQSLAICNSLSREIKGIKVLHHVNRGVSYTRNRGLREALGKYVMFVDADDVMCAGWYRCVQRELESENDVIYFSGNVSNIHPNKESIVDSIFGIRSSENLGMMTSPCSKLYRRSFLLNWKILFDEAMINGEDAIFNLQVIVNAKQYTFVKKSIYLYRIHAESSTKKYNKKFYVSNLKYFEMATRILDKIDYISAEKKMLYLGHSFYYSIYLLLFLINTISNSQERKKELVLFKTNEMKQMYVKYKNHKDRKLYNVFAFLVMHKLPGIAMEGVKVINIIRKIVKKQMFWEEI